MRIFTTFVSGPDRGKSRYIGIVYADDTEILRFDSDAPNPRLEPRVQWMEQPWVEQETPGYWKDRTGVCQRDAQINQQNVNKLRAHYNQSEDGENARPVRARPPWVVLGPSLWVPGSRSPERGTGGS